MISALKIFSPLVLVATWWIFVRHHKNRNIAGPALFALSFVAFSQNFELIYRELHQLIQLFMAAYAVLVLCKKKVIPRLNIIFALFLTFIAISIFANTFDADSVAQTVNFVVVIAVTNYLYISLRPDDRIYSFFSFVSIIAAISGALGIVEYIGTGGNRAEATFANPNYYAFFLGIASCFAIQELRGRIRYICATLILLGILVSGSRSGMAFVVLQFAWGLYCRPSLKRVFFGLGIASALLVVVVAIGGRFLNSDAAQASDAERKIFAAIALQMANDHPLTGVGWGRFISEFGGYGASAHSVIVSSGEIDVSGHERRVSHNDFLRILAELGWVAFVTVALGCIFQFHQLIKNRANDPTFLFPIWLGVVLFSVAHNNLNTALSWFCLFLPMLFMARTRAQNRELKVR